jgi:hypothetical protein
MHTNLPFGHYKEKEDQKVLKYVYWIGYQGGILVTQSSSTLLH